VSEEAKPEQSKSETREEKSDQDNRSTVVHKGNKLKAKWVMVMLTAVLFGVEILQWRSMQKSLSVTEETFIVGNRAYLTYAESSLSKWDTRLIAKNYEHKRLGLLPRLTVTLKNTGNTPASHISGWSTIGGSYDALPTTDTPLPQAENLLSEVPSTTTLGKDGTITFGGRYELGYDQLQNIIFGEKFLIVYGHVTYVDIFKKTRNTRFCMFYNRQEDELAPCPGHNYID